jgi:3'(2'), 5'-bisphosphate nucleotidase
MQRDDLLLTAVHATIRAGSATLEVYESDLHVDYKQDHSPLTLADTRSHEIIAGCLKRTGIPVLSEEGRDIPAAERRRWRRLWVVDPLDGTKEFIKGLPEYTVNIALVHECVPVLGVIYVPPVGRLYAAAQGEGARRCEGGHETLLHPRGAARPRSAVVSRSHLSPETEGFLARLGITTSLPSGSSLKMCAVAEGAADVYPRLGPTRLWDTAAGAAIAREAGCDVVDLAGQPLAYDLARGLTQAGFLVCAPGGCLAACVDALGRTH